MSDDLNWASARHYWPHAEHSRFERVGALNWHVQIMGDGEDLLLIHGTGASTHSWADLMPLLAASRRVVAVDLPGHGFTDGGSDWQSSLPGMASVLADLLKRLDIDPCLVVGHSAGAAIMARLCLDGRASPRAMVSINGALLPLSGLAGQLFAPTAKLLALSPWVPRLFSWRAGDRRMVARLVRETGSRPPARTIDVYHRLVSSPRHVSDTLRMMANWDLAPLSRQLALLQPELYLVTCGNDRTLPPSEGRRVHRKLPGSQLIELPGLGHLGHEEDPARFAELIGDIPTATAG